MDAWDQAVAFVDDIAALAEREVARAAITEIFARWPEVDTGYSKANNWVVEGIGVDVPLEPALRPEVPIPGLAQTALAKNERTLDQHVLPGPLTVGNAVPYVEHVGGEDYVELLYAEAAKAGAAIGVRAVDENWHKLVR